MGEAFFTLPLLGGAGLCCGHRWAHGGLGRIESPFLHHAGDELSQLRSGAGMGPGRLGPIIPGRQRPLPGPCRPTLCPSFQALGVLYHWRGHPQFPVSPKDLIPGLGSGQMTLGPL